jgi:hypothetical protein
VLGIHWYAYYFARHVNKLVEKGGKKASPPKFVSAQKFVQFVLFCAGLCPSFVPFCATFPFFFRANSRSPPNFYPDCDIMNKNDE